MSYNTFTLILKINSKLRQISKKLMKLNYKKLNNKEYTFLGAKIKIMSQLTTYLYF